MRKTIRIAICNVQTGIGTTQGYWQYLTTGWKYAFPHGSAPILKAAEFIKSESIDIALFTEIGGGSKRTRNKDQVRLISQHTDLKQNNFFPTFIVGDRINQGNGICSRYPLRFVRNHRLPGAGEPRYLGESEVYLGDYPVRIFVTHLSLKLTVRKPQIHHLAAIIRQKETPAILGGDFNISVKDELAILTESQLEMAASAPTFPSWNPVKHLDHLFISGQFRAANSYTFDRYLFSDHIPFVVDICLQV